jgi:hypothetical protein
MNALHTGRDIGRRLQRVESPQLCPTLVERKRSSLDVPNRKGSLRRETPSPNALTGLSAAVRSSTRIELVANPFQLFLGFLAVGNTSATPACGTPVRHCREPETPDPVSTAWNRQASCGILVVGPYHLFGQRGLPDPFTVVRMYGSSRDRGSDTSFRRIVPNRFIGGTEQRTSVLACRSARTPWICQSPAGIVPRFAQRRFDPLPVRDINGNASEQVEMACFAMIGNLLRDVRGCRLRRGCFTVTTALCVSTTAHRWLRTAWPWKPQHVTIRFVPPLFGVHRTPCKGFVEIQVPSCTSDPYQRREIVHEGSKITCHSTGALVRLVDQRAIRPYSG